MLTRAALADEEGDGERVILYMYLQDEGTDVWRAVEAERVGEDTFQILGPMDEDETWEFPPGSVVRAERRLLDSGEYLVAVAG